ncbi:hypothetical protein D6829_00675 [Candidatus Pacearchaeota archaeon]|nr:MAG: hypothetical protein D6829_00675 [Candidatus Pacearchaeota archaeon]
MHKIPFIGAHGIRKTTYCHEIIFNLKKRGINADYLGEVARDSPFPVNEETTEHSQRWILHTQISRELEFESRNPDVLVCDRGVLDNYAYYVRAFGRNPVLDALVREHSRTYSAIFKIPVTNLDIEDDGFRSTSKSFQKEIDDIVDSLLSEFRIKYISFRNIESTLRHITSEVLGR